MKITCSKSDLVNGINIVSKAVPTRSSMAILECILVDATENVIKLTANDMDMGIETIVDGEIDIPGIIALDAKTFGDIVRKFSGEYVTITTEDLKTSITCEKARFDITGKSSEDFSYIPAITRNEPIIVSQLTLKDLITKTSFSISDKDTNKVMTGEFFDIKNNVLKVVSLDGHRVSIRKVELKNSTADNSVIIPGKTVNEISKIINGGSDDLVNIYITSNHVIFEFDKTTVVSRTIDGEFFKVDQMLSADYTTKVKVNKKELLDCIDRSTLLVKEGDKKPIIVGIGDNSMQININSFIGSMDENISIEKEGKDIMIGLNPKFMIDALRSIDDETVTIYTLNAKSPCYIKADDESYIYIILPVNFTNAGV